MRHLVILLPLFLAACGANKQEISTIVTHGADGKPFSTETRQYLTEGQWEAQQRASVDIALANATSDCWKNHAPTPATLPTGLTGTDLAMAAMANALLESNRAMASLTNDTQPCSNMGTNSNDVLIAKENGRTVRSQSMHSTLGKVAGFAVGGYGVGKVVDGLSGLAIDALRANSAVSRDAIDNAGDRITTNITGDGNRSNTTSQTADNGSTISDSGNYTEAGGIPLNRADVEPVALGTESETETPEDPQEPIDVVDEASCNAAGGTWREATEQELEDGIDIDGFICSDGDGGFF